MDQTADRGTPPWFEEIDHTGDVGIIVRAPELKELFVRAARGMFSVLTDLDGVEARESRQIRLEADDREALMVAWLSELNFVHCTKYVLFSAFTIDHLDDYLLEATVGGEPIDPERHTVYTEIKAVTYHQLELQETEQGWVLQIIFDM